MNQPTIKERIHLKKSSLGKTLLQSLLVLFFLLTPFHVAASVEASEQLSLNLKNATLIEAITKVESLTGYAFYYNHEVIDNKERVNVSLANAEKEEVVREILPNYNYKIEKNKVVILSHKHTADVATQSDNGKTIEGVVLDNFGDVVIGASVMIKGSSVGTITDIDGKFSLKAKQGDLLVISFLGYESYTLKVDRSDSYKVTLKEDSKLLDEVVVVGYGVEKKVNVIGSIAQVSAKKLENRSTPALSNALTGQMPGVTIIQRTGKPGASGGTISVRGVGSFGATPDALILIDGIPGSLNDVRPEDVENISVLKDASTAAIYGSRAANGVVLVTTKTGRKTGGKIDVSYNGYVGMNRATELPKFVNSWEWATLYNRAKGGVPTYSAEDIQQMKDGSNPDRFANEHYLNEILDNTGFQTGHDVTMNGGSDKNQYLISLGVLSQDGIVKKNDFTRYSGRINLVNQLHRKLKLTTRLSGLYGKVNEPNVPGGDDASGMTGIIQKAVRFPGLYPSKTSKGEWGMGPENHGTPVSWIESDSFFQNSRHSLTANMNLAYNPIKDLTLSGTGAYRYSYSEDRAFKSNQKLEGDRTMGPSFFRNTIGKTVYKSFQATADYNKSIKDHNFGALIGYAWEEQRARSLQATRDNYPSNDLPEINVGSEGNMQNKGTTSEWALQSYFGRLKYNFKERYLFEATMRYDGSSRFPSSDKYAFFPSAGIGWRLSEEAFIKENENLQWIDNLKLKGSAGKLGNQNIGNYPYQSVYNFGYNYPFGGVINQGAAVGTYVDPTLKWEETATYDIGFETILWGGLLSADITYFHRKTSDILYAPSGSVSKVLGLNLSQMNTGKLKNTGWEFEVGHRNKVGQFSYNINANFSIIKNEVLSLGVGNITQSNGMVGNGSSLFVGYPMQMYYGYVADGVFLDQADIDAWHDQSAVTPKPQPGDIRYKDISGPDGKPDGVIDSKYDRVSLGSRIPKYTYGISLGADYKGFDFSMLLQGVGGVKGMLSEYAGLAFRSDKGNVQRWQADGAFDPEHPTRNPAYPRLEILSNVATPNTVNSSFWIRSASYLRIKSMQLGYSLPRSALSKIRLNAVRFYLQGENLVTWHNFPKGWDPEINTDGNYYPILKTLTLGLNIKF